MELLRLTNEDFVALVPLHIAYKEAIGEDAPSSSDLCALKNAIEDGRILFFGCRENDRLVGCCSVSITFSTFCYASSGVFEDFYILPAYRHRGIARALVRFAYENSGVASMTVGCAGCDLPMYKSLGFSIPIGNLLAYEHDIQRNYTV
ncbi:MAG: GNAT family N-acetyltransferase [Clostridia bacterium]|nr:GNAT family N-acetyltransferase [Clostridia bacterium]